MTVDLTLDYSNHHGTIKKVLRVFFRLIRVKNSCFSFWTFDYLSESSTKYYTFSITILISVYFFHHQGKKYKWTRKECDKAFEANMNTLCILWDQSSNKNSFSSSWNVMDRLKAVFTVAKDLAKWMTLKCNTLGHCLQASRVYYSSVDGFGAGQYGTGGKACSLQCAKPFGAPGSLI